MHAIVPLEQRGTDVVDFRGDEVGRARREGIGCLEIFCMGQAGRFKVGRAQRDLLHGAGRFLLGWAQRVGAGCQRIDLVIFFCCMGQD